jgi:sarcosine oxidase subunit beta
METADIIVIGGGVVGAACAYNLARADLSVILLEKSEIASGASGGSAGGVRQQNRAAAELPLAMAANQIWRTLEQELDADLEYRRFGHINLADQEQQLPALEASVERQKTAGLDIRMVYEDELRDLVPAAGPQIIAGAYSQGDGFANPILTTRAFSAAARRYGAKIRTRTKVETIRKERSRVMGVESSAGPIASRWVINAAGAWSQPLCAQLGVILPIRPEAKQMMVTERRHPMLKPVVTCLGRGLSVKQMPQGQFVVGGGWPGIADMVADRGWPRAGSPNGSARELTAVLPATASLHVLRIWNSLEACSADVLPALGDVEGLDGFLVAIGFSGHGFALAPAIGVLLTEYILTGKTSVAFDELRVRRFLEYDQEKTEGFLRGNDYSGKASTGGLN